MALRRGLGRAFARTPRSLQDRMMVLALRAIMVSAAVAVTEPARFALNELFLRHVVHGYQLRRSGRSLFVRHPGSDAWVVHEVIKRGVYLPPPEAARAIERGAGPPRIVDVGANIGSATLLFLERFPDARVLALEPNPENAALLRRTNDCNSLSGQCEVREIAAGTSPGVAQLKGFAGLVHFVRENTAEAVDRSPFLRPFQKEEGPPARIEVVDVLPLLDGADLVKMDIEGAEWPILQDPRFAGLRIASIVLEYHPQGAPAEDTTQAVRALLQNAGFTVGEPFDQHDGVGLIWAWRE